MPRDRLLVRSNSEFRRQYRHLGPGDGVLGLIPLRPGEEIKFHDLLQRGVTFFPPALAQLLSRSKVAQAEVLGDYMVPGSFVAYGLADLASHLPEYQAQEAVITKRDRAHLGLGVSLWPSLESLYSLAGLQGLVYPIVVQPFVPGARDFRVVVLGDYVEAYERVNTRSFRKNLFQGGAAAPAVLSPEQLAFCREAMARGRFPYAIVDLLLSPQGQPLLSEISFKGGLTGARLSQQEFRRRVAALEEDFYQTWVNS